MNLIGDVKGKVAVMVDDMIDTAGEFKSLMDSFTCKLISHAVCTFLHLDFVTGNHMMNSGTITSAAALLHQEGAKAVYACCTHAVFRYNYFLHYLFFATTWLSLIARNMKFLRIFLDDQVPKPLHNCNLSTYCFKPCCLSTLVPFHLRPL